MHGLTGTDSTQPRVNMCRQDRISALAVRRCIYFPLNQTHNSTESQLPRLRGADNTCKRHHSQPLPAHIYSLLLTLSVWTALHLTMFVTSTVERLFSESWVCVVVTCVWICAFTHAKLPSHGEIKGSYMRLPTARKFLWSLLLKWVSSSQESMSNKAACWSYTFSRYDVFLFLKMMDLGFSLYPKLIQHTNSTMGSICHAYPRIFKCLLFGSLIEQVSVKKEIYHFYCQRSDLKQKQFTEGWPKIPVWGETWPECALWKTWEFLKT